MICLIVFKVMWPPLKLSVFRTAYFSSCWDHVWRDTCSWKGYLGNTLSHGKFLFKFERPSEVGKKQVKLKSFFWSLKLSLKSENFAAVGNFWRKLESLNQLEKLSQKLESVTQNLPTSSVPIQLQLYFTNSSRTFQLHCFQFHVGRSNLKLSNFSFFPTALSNYTYPRLNYLFG